MKKQTAILSPAEVEHLFAAGWTALQSNRPDQAEEAFLGVIAAEPAHIDALNGLGNVYFQEKRLEEAEAMHEKARKASLDFYGGKMPTHVDWQAPHDRGLLRAMHGLALTAYRRGNATEASRRFKELLALNPDDQTGAHFMLEDLRKGRKKWDDA